MFGAEVIIKAAIKSVAQDSETRKMLADTGVQIITERLSQETLYSGKANDIARISKNLTDDQVQDINFETPNSVKNTIITILRTNLGTNNIFDEKIKSDDALGELIGQSITNTDNGIISSDNKKVIAESQEDNFDDAKIELSHKDRVQNILQDIQSELLKKAPIAQEVGHFIDNMIESQQDKLENIAKNAGENAFVSAETLLKEKGKQETKAVQVDTHLKNVIDTVKNSPKDTLFPVTDTVKDTVIAQINNGDTRIEFSDADKAILTQSIEGKIGNHTEIQLAEITRDDMINIITDFGGKLLKANAPVTAQARALIDANTEYAQEKMKTVMQGALFDIAGITAEQAQGKTPIEAVKGAVKEQVRGTVFEELGLTPEEKIEHKDTPLAEIVKQKAKQAVTDSQADIGKTIINGVFQAAGNGLSNIIPTIFNHTVAPVAKAVGMEKPLNDGIEKIHNFAKNNPKMALAGKLGGGLAGVLLATKLFSMGLGTIFSPTPPPPPPPKTVTDFLWNNSPWIAPMAIPPAMSFIGSLWNMMFGRTNHQSDLSRLMEQMGQMGQNATPEPQRDSHQDAMNAMMAIFANGLGKIHGG